MKELYDRIAVRGVGSLTDAELLGLVIGDCDLAERVLASAGSLSNVARMELARLRMVEGLGLRRAEDVVVCTELGRRLAMAEAQCVDVVRSSSDIVRMFRPMVENLTHEECWAIYMNNSNRVVESCRISQGGVQATIVDTRIIIKRAIELLATQIIIVHNHPSGVAQPSEADRTLTRKISEAARLFDIRLTDHIVVASADSYSFADNGEL